MSILPIALGLLIFTIFAIRSITVRIKYRVRTLFYKGGAAYCKWGYEVRVSKLKTGIFGLRWVTKDHIIKYRSEKEDFIRKLKEQGAEEITKS